MTGPQPRARRRGARAAALAAAALLACGGPLPAAAAPPAASGALPSSPAPSSPAPAAPAYRWPLSPPEVTRGFDPPAFRYGAGHRGVDLAGAPGQAVRAAGPGVVAFAGDVAGRGVVSIDHPSGLRTTYEPLTPTVRAGEAVTAGRVIGRLAAGHAGCPAAACLHWGLRDGEDYRDPRTLLGAVRIRLLPV